MEKFSTDDHNSEGPVTDVEAGRRTFMRNMGLGAAGVALAGVSSITPAMASGDTDILNFALNLEYLEAEFYLRAYTGMGLSADNVGSNPGLVTGGKKVPFSSPIVGAYAEEIAQDEQNHVIFLRTALKAAGGGSGPVSRPPIDLDTSFTTLARAAGLIGPGEQFDAFANDTNFLLAAYIFEDVGVSAYHGAAPLIANKTYLDAAAGILATEAYHAGLVRTVLFGMGQSMATKKISKLRQALGPARSAFAGSKDDGVGIWKAPNVVLTDLVGITPTRDTRAVLNVVYGAQGASKGLFFPAGMRGPINK